MEESDLQAIAESLTLSGALDQAAEAAAAELAADPEWSTPKPQHQHSLVEAFAVGVIRADPFHWGYRLPPEFESVVNYIADRIQRHWPGDEIPRVSLNEFRALLEEWAMEHPAFRAWNETDKLVGISYRGMATATERDFIDLEAVFQNASCHLRNETRSFEAFNEKFDREWEAEHGSPPDWSRP
jgi:hypothetical protein